MHRQGDLGQKLGPQGGSASFSTALDYNLITFEGSSFLQ